MSSTTSNQSNSKQEVQGMLMVLLSSFTLSTSAVFLKKAATALPSVEIIFIRSLGQLILMFILCKIKNADFLGPVEHRKLLVLRGFLGAAAVTSQFWAIVNMELSDVNVILFVGPLLTLFLARFMLNEPLTPTKIASLIIGFFGIVLVSRPSFIFGKRAGTSEYPYRSVAITVALIGSVMNAFNFVLIRKIGLGVSYLTMVWHFVWPSFLISIPLYFATKTPHKWPSVLEWVNIEIVTVGYLMGQIILNIGLQRAPAGSGSIIRNMDIVFGFIYGILIFGENVQLTGVIGCGLVGLVTYLIAREKYMEYISKKNAAQKAKPVDDELEGENVEMAELKTGTNYSAKMVIGDPDSESLLSAHSKVKGEPLLGGK
eukprot:NODE_116_length_19003_cov_0.233707.p4 type:complete len:372 gc:universal NODE_116_length_19003_cov_0.233707:1468-353(-)